MSGKVILTDVDGVLLNWDHSFDAWMRQEGFRPLPDHLKHYCVGERYGIPKTAAKKMINHFNQSAMVGFIPPFLDAVKHVRKLHEEHGYVFHTITSLHKNPEARKLRVWNLENLFGKTVFERHVILGCGDDKDSALDEYRGTGHIWLEDKFANVQAGAAAGLRCFMMQHPWNTAHSPGQNFTLVRSWKDFCGHIV